MVKETISGETDLFLNFIEKEKRKEKKKFSYRWTFKDDRRRLPGDTDGALAVGQLGGHAGNVNGSSGLKNSTHALDKESFSDRQKVHCRSESVSFVKFKETPLHYLAGYFAPLVCFLKESSLVFGLVVHH